MNSFYKIGDVAKLLDISVQAIHHYEKVGLIHPKKRLEESKHRFYSQQDVTRLAYMKANQEKGFSLKQIKELNEIPHSPNELLTYLEAHINKTAEEIYKLEKHLKEMKSKKDDLNSYFSYPLSEITLVFKEERTFLKKLSKKMDATNFWNEKQKIIINNYLTDNNPWQGPIGLVSYNDLAYSQQFMYTGIIDKVPSILNTTEEKYVLPAGIYAVLTFQDLLNKELSSYYIKMIEFLSVNHLAPLSDFHETILLSKVPKEDIAAYGFGKIEILVESCE